LWSCAVESAMQFLTRKCRRGSKVAEELMEEIFVPISKGCPILTERLVKYTSATQIVSVCSLVKPWNASKFLTHLCLSSGTYCTEWDLFGSGSLKNAYAKAGLCPDGNSISHQDLLNILRAYVVTDLAYQPITARRFSKYLVAAWNTLNNFANDNFCSYTPCISYIMLKDEATGQVYECEERRRKCLIEGLLEDPVVAAGVPADFASANADVLCNWRPCILPDDRVRDEAVAEQTRALDICVRAIDWFINPFCRGVKFPCLVGRPGSGKSHVLKLATLYAIAKGLKVELMALTSERARKLGGNHLHLVFPLPIGRGRTEVTHTVAFDCLKNLDLDKSRKLLLKRTDVFVVEEIGLISAQIFATLDIVLQHLMQNTQPWGGKLLLCTGDARQLPPISGHPVWSSINMCTMMNVVLFTTYVRARDDDLRWINDETRRTLTTVEAERVAQFIVAKCTMVNDWSDVPGDAVRIVSTRAAEEMVMHQYLSGRNTQTYQALDEVQNATRWGKADMSVTRRLNKVFYEYEQCQLFIGAVVRLTYNDRHAPIPFSQGQLSIVVDLPNKSTDSAEQTVKLCLAPPGVRHINPANISTEWPRIQVRRRTTPAVPVGRGVQMARRTQFPLRYHLASTIHRIQGETLAVYATQLSSVKREF